MIHKNKQKGFTIIELVVVILLLGILTATALPRFMDISDDAHRSVVQAVQGSLNSGLLLYRSEWIASGQEPNNTPDSYEVTPGVSNELPPTANGYPAIDADADCGVLYSRLLSGAGGQPTYALTTEGPFANHAAITGAGESADFTGIRVTGDADACYFVYTGDDPAEMDGNFYLYYDSATGNIIFGNTTASDGAI